MQTVLRRFDSPDEVRTFEKGRLELITISGQTLGRATYQSGWKWSDLHSTGGARQLGGRRRTICLAAPDRGGHVRDLSVTSMSLTRLAARSGPPRPCSAAASSHVSMLGRVAGLRRGRMRSGRAR
jgi:hypothetical protein